MDRNRREPPPKKTGTYFDRDGNPVVFVSENGVSCADRDFMGLLLGGTITPEEYSAAIQHEVGIQWALYTGAELPEGAMFIPDALDETFGTQNEVIPNKENVVLQTRFTGLMRTAAREIVRRLLG